MPDDLMPRIIERVHRRRERYSTEEVDVLPPPTAFPDESVIVGGYTRTTTQTLRRFLRKDVLISVDHSSDTPSALAKDYLKIVYRRGPVVTHTQGRAIVNSIAPHPLYCNPTEFECGYYVDIASCYWSIMDAAGWNVDYFPGKWLSIGRKPHDFPWPDRGAARNCLVSCSTSSSMIQWDAATDLHVVAAYNPLLNKSLYALINDVLNAIAAQAVEAGAVYVHTDGYIAPDDRSASRICAIITDWGLRARIKAHGPGLVLSTQCYRVGASHSAHLSDEPKLENGIKPVEYARWLQARMAYAASLRDLTMAED